MRDFLETDERPRFAWHTATTSVAVRNGTVTITANGASRFEDVRAVGKRVFEACDVPDDLPDVARPRLYGGFSFYEAGSRSDLWDGFDNAVFVLPEVQLIGDGTDWWLTVTATGRNAAESAETTLTAVTNRLESESDPPLSDPPGVTHRELTPDRNGWRDQVSRALQRVSAGTLEKVVLSQALTLTLSAGLSLPVALERLGGTYPNCYRFAFSPPGGGTFFGATPERLVSLQDRTVKTEALAGSTGRGETSTEDEWLATELQDSEKDRHEHDLVVDAICDQLEPLASSVTTGDRTIRRLATVQHLRTPITAELVDDEHVLSLVEALHPTPAVGGLPPGEALETIRETETFDRGWYAAPIGWFDAAGNGTFAVAIRSALARDQTATLFAGAGIVADSDPDRELDEVQLKYHPMLDELE